MGLVATFWCSRRCRLATLPRALVAAGSFPGAPGTPPSVRGTAMSGPIRELPALLVLPPDATKSGGYPAIMSVTTMTLRVPDDLAPSIRAAASEAGLSVNAYVVRAARRAATLDAAKQLATLGLGDDLAGEGDTL